MSHYYQTMGNHPCTRAGVRWAPRKLSVVLDCHSKYIREKGFFFTAEFWCPTLFGRRAVNTAQKPIGVSLACRSWILTTSPKIQTAVEISCFLLILGAHRRVNIKGIHLWQMGDASLLDYEHYFDSSAGFAGLPLSRCYQSTWCQFVLSIVH